MAAAPDNGMLRPPGPPPLGAILVRRGLLTEEQLNAALAESHRTGEPTGEVIVRLGFASAATVAQALATQHGGPLKTEFGYAVGFGGAAPVGPVGPPPVSVPAQEERPTASAPASAVRATPPVEPAPVPAPPPPAAPPAQPDPALLKWQQHAQQLAAERDAALRNVAATEARVAELERALAELRESAAADDGHLAAATARVAELESAASRDAELDAKLAAAREETARVRMEKVALEAAHESMSSHTATLEERLKEASAQIAHLEAERADVLKVAKALGEERRHHDHADDPAHLLFVPGNEGYRLVEQDGPPPAPGTTVELPEDDGTAVRLLVTKVGSSPLPGTRLACAYLVAAA